MSQSGTAIAIAAGALELRQRRARCRFERGEIMEGVADLNHVLQINTGNTEPSPTNLRHDLLLPRRDRQGYHCHLQVSPTTTPTTRLCAKLRKSEKYIDRTLKKFNTFFEKRQFASAVKLLIPHSDEPGLLQEVKDDIANWRAAGYIHPTAPDGLYGHLVERTCEAYTEMNNFKKAQAYCDEAPYLQSHLPPRPS